MSDDTAINQPSATSLDIGRVEQHLRQQLERSATQLIGLESVLNDMLRGHDTLQEDRDSTRLVVNSVREDVRQIRAALSRNGTYGRCVNCNSTIASERPEAIPSVSNCTRCA